MVMSITPKKIHRGDEHSLCIEELDGTAQEGLELYNQ